MIISLTTDFGTRDGYVGTMKGVMAAIAPGAAFVDITHTIRPQNVREAAYVLWTSLPYFPHDAVHLVVVDPGVGTARRAIASRTSWGMLVGPDNGVFSYIWAAAPPDLTVALENPAYHRVAVSKTFHGRDIFSPAAAHLAAGVPIKELGPEVKDLVRFPTPSMKVTTTSISGEVLYVDHFGNVITSIGRLVWDEAMLHLDPVFVEEESRIVNADRSQVVAAGHNLGRIRRTYGEVAKGEPLALVGSEGMLEIAVNHGHGADTVGLKVGDPVEVKIV